MTTTLLDEPDKPVAHRLYLLFWLAIPVVLSVGYILLGDKVVELQFHDTYIVVGSLQLVAMPLVFFFLSGWLYYWRRYAATHSVVAVVHIFLSALAGVCIATFVYYQLIGTLPRRYYQFEEQTLYNMLFREPGMQFALVSFFLSAAGFILSLAHTTWGAFVSR